MRGTIWPILMLGIQTVWKIWAFLWLTATHPKILKIDTMLYQLKLTPWVMHRNKSNMNGMKLFLSSLRRFWYATWWFFHSQYCFIIYFDSWKRWFPRRNKHIICKSQNLELPVKNQNAPEAPFFFTPKIAQLPVDYQ